MTKMPTPTRVNVGEIDLAVYEAGPKDGPTIVLVHGWPELAHSWKNQIGPLADAGYHVLAPDVRGFGGSDNPKDKDQYTIHHLTGDLKGLLDAKGVDKAIFAGHDWGGFLVWPMAQLHPDRVAGVIGVCTPHRKSPPVAPLRILEKRYTDKHYFIRFQEIGMAESVFEGHEEKFFRMMFRPPAPRKAWDQLVPWIFDVITVFQHFDHSNAGPMVIPEEELHVYVEAYKKSGFHGGINLYRNVDGNYHLMKNVDPVINLPALMISAELDLFLPPETADQMDRLVPGLERQLIPDCGHWVMWEKPDALNAHMLEWLTRKFPV